ncbi:unnamed protein product [Tenebrio molitor]|jgi:cationic amino acid transport permease|nr:unnamed protein product [Tenebrio molitor]
MDTAWRVLTRKKILDPVTTEQSELGRVLNTVDLTALGVGSTLGVGVYVLAGHVAKDTAGPAVVISFLIATIASVFAGLCYAEFGARTPRAGSAYIYSYVCVGEFVAFVIGWNLILEYVIGSASVARGLSLYLDTLINDTLKDTFRDIAPLGDVDFLSKYFDFFAFGVSLILAVALAFGLKESSWVNNIFTLLNLAVVAFVIVAGGMNAKGENWRLPANASNPDDHGGFMPFGVEGMIKGAATCFYGFVGFDCIATTGEEVKNPKKAIPVAIVLSLFIIFLAYFGTSTVVTLMLPYYDQDPNAPLPHAFETVGWPTAKWIVAIGGIFGLCASLFGAMFPLPRIIYAMASDSLIFRFLGRVSSRFKTPVVGTLLAGLLTGLMAALFDLKQLVNMMSIGTLLAYTIVAASVLLLRYSETRGLDETETNEEVELMDGTVTSSGVFKQIFNCGRHDFPSKLSERIVKIEVCLYCVLCVLIGLCAIYLKKYIGNGEAWAIVLTAIVVFVTVLVIMSMTTQPKSRKELTFKVPLVPLIPALSILINVYLMLMLDPYTWIRFAVWMVIGIPIYYFSVQSQSDARNESISSRDSQIVPHEKQNGYTNHGCIDFDHNITTVSKKRPAPPPPTLRNIEATIADLDEMLDNEEANIIGDRKFSVDSLSTASNVLREENVEADVHCSDVPVTPVKVVEAPPLLESCDVTIPPSPSSIVADSSEVAAIETSTADEAVVALVLDGESESSREPQTVETDTTDFQTVEEKEDQSQSAPPTAETEQTTPVNLLPPPPPEPIVENEPAIPPPPSFLAENPKVAIPRPLLSGLSNVKLKPVREVIPDTPSVDYSRENSTDDNLKFGTQEYKEFLEQLDQKLQLGYVPTQVVVNLKAKPAPNLPNEDVIDDNIDRKEAKEKLAQFLARTNSLPLFGSRNHNHDSSNHVQRKYVAKPSDEVNDREQHRQNMKNILGSIRLTKKDSFKTENDTTEEENSQTQDIEQPNNRDNSDLKREQITTANRGNDERLDHKRNMDDVFKSIRLRKMDSFKANESQ